MIDLPAAMATSPPTDSLGCRTGQLQQHQQLVSHGLTVHRRRSQAAPMGPVGTPASARGHLVGISLCAGHRRRIFHSHHSSLHDFDAGDVYVRSFAHDYRADLQTGFDFLLLEIEAVDFERAMDERLGRQRLRGLESVAGLPDPVLSHLGAALLPALQRPLEASPLFIEQMGVVIQTHLLDQYGGRLASPPRARPWLSDLHERRAKDMLRNGLDGSGSIAEVAAACSLSRSHFIKAFRETTGHTPHQWLQGQRVERARALLRDSSAPLAEVATLCGFADQSHFTRVFTRWTKRTPGRWRKDVRA